MKKAEVTIGKVYAIKVSGKLAPVKIDSPNEYGGWKGVSQTTNREIHIRSAAKLRFEVEQVEGKWKRKV